MVTTTAADAEVPVGSSETGNPEQLYREALPLLESDAVGAVDRVRRSAEAGYARAQVQLAHWHHFGWETLVAEDREQAQRLVREALAAGEVVARVWWAHYGASDPLSAADEVKRAVTTLTEAHRDEPLALYLLARSFDRGTGVAPDFAAALPLYERAANQGQLDALCELGARYEQGNGVPQSTAKAVELYCCASYLSRAWIVLSRGFRLQAGGSDLAGATQLFSRAADLGLPEAIDWLAGCYDEGRGVARDSEKAAELYQRAAHLGHLPSLGNLARCYAEGRGVRQNPALALSFLQRAARLGDDGSMANLGVCHELGQHGVPQDYKEAIKWYQQAVDLGNDVGLYRLGLLHQKGTGVPQDRAKAAELFRRAADKGLPEAMAQLAICYEDGDGVRQDYAQAARSYERALIHTRMCDVPRRTVAVIQYNLAVLYESGRGVRQDRVMAAHLMERAADLGFRSAMHKMAHWYTIGCGVPPDAAKAAQWMQRAEDPNNTC